MFLSGLLFPERRLEYQEKKEETRRQGENERETEERGKEEDGARRVEADVEYRRLQKRQRRGEKKVAQTAWQEVGAKKGEWIKER